MASPVHVSFLSIVVIIFLTAVKSFSPSFVRSFSLPLEVRVTSRPTKGSNLYMGRHAVVRALTKARTDGAKSKNNSR